MIVGKAVRMAEAMDVPVLGLVENMSYFQCPDCHAKHEIFGKSHAEETAKQYGIPVVAKLPMDPALAAGVDAGMTELFDNNALDELFAFLEH